MSGKVPDKAVTTYQANAFLPQVLEYLVKKGYAKTEQMLRQESTHLDRDGKPLQDRAEDLGTAKYPKAFRLLAAFIDGNLDIYKVSVLSETLGI